MPSTLHTLVEVQGGMANAVDYQTPCAGPYACRLALKLAADTVGPVCRKVAECLIKHGAQQVSGGGGLALPGQRGSPPSPECHMLRVMACRLDCMDLDLNLTLNPCQSVHVPPLPQFADLLRESGLQAPLLKTALLILIQQNYVACYLKQEPPTLRGPGPKYTLYEVVLPRILQVLRWVLEPWPLVSCA